MSALTNAEWDEVKAEFPGLEGHRDECLKTDNATPAPGPPFYNCIAWSLGLTTEWINSPKRTIDFVEFYSTKGFEECEKDDSKIEVDGYLNEGGMDHASRCDNGRWSSKIGSGIRMTHPRYGLEGNVYGYVHLYFKKATTSTSSSNLTMTMTIPEHDPIAEARVNNLVTQTGQRYHVLADTFEQNWEAWTKTFDNSKLSFAQSSDDFAEGPEWDKLLAMGTSILPQVVNKLRSDQNIFGCNLYNKLQADSKKKVDPKDLDEFYVLRRQARAIVKLYATQVAEFDAFADEWFTAQRSVQTSSFSNDYTSGPAYEALRNMGGPAIPLIMERYASETHSWWPEMLHEIVHGAKSGAQSFDFEALYRQWAEWFQGTPSTVQRSE